MAMLICEREDISSSQHRDQAGLNADIRAREHAERYLVFVELRLHLGHETADRVSMVVAEIAALMGRADDRADAFFDSDPSHREGVFPGLCTVIDGRCKVAVNIDEGGQV